MTKDEALRLALEFIPSISPAFICEASHHKKHEQHASNELCPHVAKQKQVYEAIKAALEAKDEPVAWMCADESLINKGYARFSHVCMGEWKIPVYATSPQRKPLTDEEIKALDYSGTRIEFVRAIEAAHGIKGEE